MTMQSCDPSIIELFDETGKLLSSIVEGDGEVGETSVVLLISWGTLGKSIPIVVVLDLLVQDGDIGLESLHLLSVDVIPDSDHGTESVDDRSILVCGRVRCGGEDVLYGGGG